MIVHDCIQTDDRWWEFRRGIPTASNFRRVLTAVGKRCVLPAGHDGRHLPDPRALDYGIKMPKGVKRCPVTVPQISKGCAGLIAELAADVKEQRPNVFSGSQNNKPPNRAVETGKEREPAARDWYQTDQEVIVEQVGFITTDDGKLGCSPDGLVLDMHGQLIRGLELKCPELKTHNLYLLKGVLPREYLAQVHGGMVVTGLREWDFMSYHPEAKCLVVRAAWDDYTDALAVAVEAFCEMYDQALQRLVGYGFAEAMKRLHQFDTAPNDGGFPHAGHSPDPVPHLQG